MSFDKKYDSKTSEVKIREFWEKEGIFKFNPKTKKPIYSIDTPPPTISGRMHIGHAFSYTQTDFIARYKRMSGNEVFYPFGTDDNGLATEKLVQKSKGVDLRKLSREEAVKLTMEYLDEERPAFTQDFKGVGLSCDFDINYSTISPYSQKLSQKSFLDLNKKDLIEQREGPVPWDRVFQTPIAQAELEDKELKSTLNYIKAKIVGTEGTFLIYATTRPELLHGCVGMNVEDEGEYVKLKVGDEYWITGATTYADKFKKFEYEIVEQLSGQDIIGQKVIIPLSEKEVEITHDISVKADYGTGVVYYCTYGGMDCIEWMARYPHIKPIKILDAKGKLTKLAGEYEGLTASTEGRSKILKDLDAKGHLVQKENITHIVNVGERSGAEVEYIVAKQWYVKYLDKKEYFWEQAQKFNWHPEFMKHRIENWIEGLNWDWGFSRQRHFGIPIPVWHGKKTGRKYFAHESHLPIDPTQNSPMKKKKAIIFDFDGVIIDSLDLAHSLHLKYTQNPLSDKKEYAKEFFSGNIIDKVRTSGKRSETDVKKFREAEYELLKDFELIDGLKEVLEELNKEYEMFIVTSNTKKNLDLVLSNNKASHLFKEILDADFHHCKEEKINVILDKHKLKKEDCIFVTDTAGDLKEAHKAGVETVAVSYGFMEKEDLETENPTCVVDSPEELGEFLLEELEPETDVFDTWFTSASSPLLSINMVEDEKVRDKLFPMSLRPQGHDIINFWLFYTMAKTNLIYDQNPFDNVAISGWVLAPDGSKMSKSKGNTVAPQEVVEKYSNDAIRFAAAAAKLGSDQPFMEKEVQTGVKVANKIYNANKFAAMLLEEFKPSKIEYKKLSSIDKWVLAKLQTITKPSREHFDNYDYQKAKANYTNYFMQDIADNYIEIVKQRLWQKEENYESAQQTIYYALYSALRGLAPFVPFITEEVYQNFYKNYEKEKSLHLTSYPDYEKEFDNEEIVELGNNFIKVVADVRKHKAENQLSMKEELAEVEITCDKKQREFIEGSLSDLKAVTGAKEIKFKEGDFGVKIK